MLEKTQLFRIFDYVSRYRRLPTFLGTISYPELRQFYAPSRKSVKLRRQPAEKKQKLQRGSCTTIKLQLYNYRVYSCTTKGVIVVQLKGLQLYDNKVFPLGSTEVLTAVSRPADQAQQVCRAQQQQWRSYFLAPGMILSPTREETLSDMVRSSFQLVKMPIPHLLSLFLLP